MQILQSVRGWEQQGASIIRSAEETAEPVNLYYRQMQKAFISFLRADRLCLAPPLVVNLWSFVRIARHRQAGASLQWYVGTRRVRLSSPCFSHLGSFLFRVSSGEKKKKKEGEKGTINPLNNCGRSLPPYDISNPPNYPVGGKNRIVDTEKPNIVTAETFLPCFQLFSTLFLPLLFYCTRYFTVQRPYARGEIER